MIIVSLSQCQSHEQIQLIHSDDTVYSCGAGVTEEISHIQGQRRSPSKTVGRAKSCLESNPIPARDTQRAQTNLMHTRTQRPHRYWDKTVFEPLLWRYGVSSGLPQGQGLWMRQTWVWHEPSWRRAPLTPPQSSQNLHRTGK